MFAQILSWMCAGGAREAGREVAAIEDAGALTRRMGPRAIRAHSAQGSPVSGPGGEAFMGTSHAGAATGFTHGLAGLPSRPAGHLQREDTPDEECLRWDALELLQAADGTRATVTAKPAWAKATTVRAQDQPED